MSAVIQQSLLARAEGTPLLLGKKGSSLDLVVEALYFQPKGHRGPDGSRRGRGRRHRPGASDPDANRVVGASSSRWSVRAWTTLRSAASKPPMGARSPSFGECVIGADVAATLGLNPGDSILTSPSTLFDLAGVYPLRLHVVGTLQPSYGPDDRAVFVDVKTAMGSRGARPRPPRPRNRQRRRPLEAQRRHGHRQRETGPIQRDHR